MIVRSGRGGRPWFVAKPWFFVAAVVAVLGFWFLTFSAAPAAAESGSLTPEQESLAGRIDGQLIAPCCYTQTVSVHDSQKAEEIKMQVRLLIAQGMGEGEIVDSFVAQYGEEILAAPRASGFNWLAYLLPALVVLVAMGGVAVLLVRWRDGRDEPVLVRVPSRDDAGSGPDPLRRRLEDELAHYDP